MNKIIFNDYSNQISRMELFSGFSEAELSQQFESLKYRINEYDKGQIIHLQNEQCQTMDIILAGQVAVSKIDKNGNSLKIDVFSRDDILGANLIFSHRNVYPMTVVAETPALVLHLYRELIVELSQNNVGFMVSLLTAISDCALILTDKINTLSLKTIRHCIIDYLRFEYYRQKTKKIKLEITKKEFADRLGVQRTSLSRELNKMRKDGLIDYDSKTITIKTTDVFANPKNRNEIKK